MSNTSNNLFEASHQWASRPADQRFKSLGELAAAVKGRRSKSRSQDIDVDVVHVSEHDGKLVVNSAIAPSEPSHWAFGQLASAVKAPAGYLRTLPTDLVVKNLNHGIEQAKGNTVKFMTVANDEGGPNTLQAVTSTTYGRIWDADVVDSVQRIHERSGGKFHNPLAYATPGQLGGPTVPSGLYASDRDVFAFMIDGGSQLEGGDRAKLHRGFYVWNSEVGSRSFGLCTFLFNAVCGNHIIWGAQNVNKLIIRHSSGGPARFDSLATPALLDFANASADKDLAAIKRAQDYLLPTKREELVELCSKFSLTKGELQNAENFAKSEEGDFRTLWHLVQGLTAYARGFDYIDARVDLEKRAGSLLNLVAEVTS